jgi:hypothetical protein
MLMRPNDGRIDHQPLEIGFARQGGENGVQNTHLDPAIIAPLDRFMFAKPPRQITPAPARARHP